MMEKNEDILLEPWILHHASLFGYENLTIIDNGSSNPIVHTLLSYYETKGCTVLRQFSSSEDFLNKGAVIASIIQGWDNANDEYDFVFPLDCDEFLALSSERGPRFDKANIHQVFESLKEHNATFVLRRVLLNIPQEPGFFRTQIIQKGFFKKGSLVELDRGFHNPVSIFPENWFVAPFTLIHLHNRYRYEDTQKYARQKLEHYINPDDPQALAEYDGPFKTYFQMSEEDYRNGYQTTACLFIPSVLTHFEALQCNTTLMFGNAATLRTEFQKGSLLADLAATAGGIARFVTTNPETGAARYEFILYDAESYGRHNPDIVQHPHYTTWPLVHFLEHGFAEQRKCNDMFPAPFALIDPA
ncbi:glycosyltransferase family 2 protein [Entomobacter blattae]|uniref:Glycosyl transferase family 2 n=1 Tax=Entomobacter blattae TaxID=2762277 RepID=A0A7H1NR41_9PROT|nr:glycosyltransferase family 2 protein [Entomobacter blattae]QNT78251.1 hypothetical protein JGUZn3_10230 [Entomobacter blattae]